MAYPIIEVENLCKLYSLGKVGTGSLRQEVKRWWTSAVMKKDDPFFNATAEADASRLWALKDVSFDVKEGEVFGVIGSNGAGKSTLLKILSNIVKPTSGKIKGRGRINSLLEIGTGFNDELSGRENIFLNGHFLGMHRQEIKSKFDEIVDFAGIEKFIDTPVKRYSSGMYMRLAFAVAAHLEPDILIVDEVLAVGDAEFQQKCLGKMHDVSAKMGRTILFVSHNTQAVVSLCQRAMHLKKGKVVEIGASQKVVNHYLGQHQRIMRSQSWKEFEHSPGNNSIRVQFVELIPHVKSEGDPITVCTPITIRFKFWNLIEGQNLCVGLHLFNTNRECVFDVCSVPRNYERGLVEGQCEVPGNFLNDGSYYFSLIFVKDTSVELFYLEECLAMEVEDYRENMNWYGKWSGHVRPKFPFVMKQVTRDEKVLLL
ncbi:MAG TPA: ABC transporter ATP-binding protein [Chryseosolibacter sp.]